MADQLLEHHRGLRQLDGVAVLEHRAVAARLALYALLLLCAALTLFPYAWMVSSSFKENAEKAFLRAKLQEYDWNVSETARKLGMPRSNLYKKIERFGLADALGNLDTDRGGCGARPAGC